MSKVYATRVAVTESPMMGEQIYVDFTQELLDELDLKDGDILTWEVDTEKVIVRKYRKKEEKDEATNAD